MNQLANNAARPDLPLRSGKAGPIRVLMELRPCFDGYAGIPQETRLLFSAFARSPDFEAGGLLNGGASPRNATVRRGRTVEGQGIFTQSAQLIALDSGQQMIPRGRRIARRLLPKQVMHRLEAIERRGTVERLDTLLDPDLFEDWLWMRLFRLGLTPQERHLLLQARYPVPQLAWHEAAALANTNRLRRRVQLDMRNGGWDIHLAHTPCPYRLKGGKLWCATTTPSRCFGRTRLATPWSTRAGTTACSGPMRPTVPGSSAPPNRCARTCSASSRRSRSAR